MPPGIVGPVDTGLDQTEVMSWIEDIVALGERPPGSAGDQLTREQIR